MAITRGAQKAVRSGERKRVFNLRRKAVLHDTVQNYRTLIGAGNTKEAEKLLPTLYQAIDKATKRGILKPNTASRMKSRLVGRLRKTS